MSRLFSERYGYKKSPSEIIQVESMDKNLRVGIWNMFYEFLTEFNSSIPPKGAIYHTVELELLLKSIWVSLFKESASSLPNHRSGFSFAVLNRFESWITESAEWYEVYDSLEFLISYIKGTDDERSSIIDYVNGVLSLNGSGYRMIDNKVVPVSNEQELSEIERALISPHLNVNHHLNEAVRLLGERGSNDFRNSVKESISAVEALLKNLVGSGKFGVMVAKAVNRYSLNEEWKTALNKIFGYVSNNGTRHAKNEGDTTIVDLNEAKFILVLCSSFINYMIGLEIQRDQDR